MTGSTTSGYANHPTGDRLLPDALCASPAGSPVNLYVNHSDSNLAAHVVADSVEKNDLADSWRLEVAARLERYRIRRKPRSPRYPSLLLPFDPPQTWSRSSSALPESFASPAAPATVPDLQLPENKEDEDVASGHRDRPDNRRSEPAEANTYDQFANVIEFPRSAAIPVFSGSELADPIFDRPRIVEAPEILPPPPALGGMLIEAPPDDRLNRRTAADCPEDSASIARRIAAAMLDGAIQVGALAAFAAIFLRLNPDLNPISNPVTAPRLLLAVGLAAVAIVLWMAYEFLFIVYTGSTPGLRVARLQLAKFDGAPLTRSRRGWRVLASFLSAFSAGLGYLWCMLDEHGLCWHDRITRTHLQSQP